MMGALSLKVLESVPNLIWRLPILLSKRSDVIPQLCIFLGRKYLLRKALKRSSQVVNEFGS